MRLAAAKCAIKNLYIGNYRYTGFLFIQSKDVKGVIMAKVSFTSSGDLLAAYLSGEIDHHSAQMLRQLIDAEISACMPMQLVLDFGNVSFMDSSGIGLILGRAKRMQAMEGSLVVQQAPDQIKKMLDLARVDYK